MDHGELRQRLKPILEAEECGDWARVEKLSDELNRELTEQKFKHSPEVVDHYLADADVRQKADQYAETQRRELQRFVDTGEHEEGTVVSLWSCGLVAALIVAAVIWLLN